MTDWHFATALERVADRLPEHTALICGERQFTWQEFDERAARLATVLRACDVPEGAKVGLYLHNGNEYLEAHHGAFKVRCCPINVNYRYQNAELRYLLDNADVEALVYQAAYAPLVAAVRAGLPGLKCLIQVPDDSGNALLPDALDYEEALNMVMPYPRLERAADDLYMLYTGGTTGMPKGVMYANGEQCQWLARGYSHFSMQAPRSVADIDTCIDDSGLGVALVTCPLMHATGMWCGAMMPLLAGATLITMPGGRFDADAVLDEIERRRVTYLTIVGDAFARPLLAALDAAPGTRDLASLRTIVSSGVMWSSEVKAGLLRHVDATLVDAMGSSEGSVGTAVTRRDNSASAGTARFRIGHRVRVLDDAGHDVVPGSGQRGMIATQSAMRGYYKDAEKTARTVRMVAGQRYVFPGDYATVEADGSITLLGRGSLCINTAGEKVFPEEVEEVLKRHPLVADALVVGVPDPRFGQKVVAVVAATAASADLDMSSLLAHAQRQLAGFKLPRAVIQVSQVQRAPNGKPDYGWALAVANAREQARHAA